jgi:hypothetical protein
MNRMFHNRSGYRLTNVLHIFPRHDDFGIKYVGGENAEHLLATSAKDWDGSK